MHLLLFHHYSQNLVNYYEIWNWLLAAAALVLVEIAADEARSAIGW